jgi:hypothetical protein
MRSKFVVIMIMLFLVAALTGAAGCGSSDDSTSSSLTKKEFIKKADKICEEGEREQLELASKYLQKHPGAEEEEMVIPAGLPPLEKQNEKIKALPAPEGDEAQIDAMVKAFEKGVEDSEANPQDVLAADTNPFKEADKLAEKYGLGNCANAP